MVKSTSSKIIQRKISSENYMSRMITTTQKMQSLKEKTNPL